jgi:predicted ATPase/transcriptional regulator with XRE-family HTH domain
MNTIVSFGEWIARRRKLLDLTQREVAVHANCAVATVKKIELGERRPSRELAQALAEVLRVPQAERPQFVECARGLRSVDRLPPGGIGDLTQTTSSVQTAAPKLPANLPASLPPRGAPILGREAELAQVVDLLSQPACRFVSLVGVGGVGKTRLAVEVAYQQRERFADGAVFVPLASLTDARLMPLSVAQSLNLSLSGQLDAQLFAYLRDKSLLLVVDNCEQILEGIDWLSTLLANAPGIKVLATSRERLQLPEEWVYPVPMLESAHAVDLFVQVAQRHNPQVQIGKQRAAALRVCHLVENLPLAIELAASWTPFMPCAQIADHIQRDINFLTNNARNIPERHRSIRAVFDHSWQLLSPVEQDAVMRLSIFRGGWAPEEARLIAGATLLTLRGLMEKSLVRPTREHRFDMHELVRQYAEEHLKATGLAEEVRARHAEVYVDLAGQLDAQLFGPDAIAAFARFDQEHDNMRAGMGWALHAQHLDLARRYVDKLFLYWLRRGKWAEGERWSKAVLGAPDEPDSVLLCWTVLSVGVFLALQGRYIEADPFRTRAQAMTDRLEDPETTARTLLILGQAAPDSAEAAAAFEDLFVIVSRVDAYSKPGMAKEALLANAHLLYGDRLQMAGQLEEAATQYRQSLDLFRKLRNVDMIAYPIGNLGRLALQDGHLQDAYASFMESLALSRAIGNRVGIADWLQQLGHAALAMGDLAQAESCYEEALALYQEMGNQRACPDVLAGLGAAAYLRGDIELAKQHLRECLVGFRSVVGPLLLQFHRWTTEFRAELFLCLQTCALVEVVEGELERAATLLGAADTLVPDHVDLGQQARVTAALSTVRSRLSRQAYTAAWTRGQSLSFEQVIAFVVG